MSKKKLKLSRRNMLAGLGTIGIASAGAGFGTWAAFSDEETAGATFGAGDLDLKLDWIANHFGNGGTTELREFDDTPEDKESVTVGVEFTDIKPGDGGWITFSIHCFGNPAWIWMRERAGGFDDNGATEPEAESEGENHGYETNGGKIEYDVAGQNDDQQDYAGTGEGKGELQKEMEFRSFYDTDQNRTVGDPEDDNYDGPGLFGNRYIKKPLRANLVPYDGPQKATGPRLLDGSREGDDDVTAAVNAYPTNEAIDPFVNSTTQYITVRWELPFEVGNHIQTDSMVVYFDFYAEQARHNPEQRFTGEGAGEEGVKKYPATPWLDQYEDGSDITTPEEAGATLGPLPDSGSPESEVITESSD